MNKQEALELLTPYIEDVYTSISSRPHIYAGRPECIEAYIAAIEGVMDFLSDGYRNAQYTRFKSAGQFGQEPLNAMFERQNACRLGFVPVGEAAALDRARELENDFSEVFSEHWKSFLEWRRDESSGQGDESEAPNA